VLGITLTSWPGLSMDMFTLTTCEAGSSCRTRVDFLLSVICRPQHGGTFTHLSTIYGLSDFLNKTFRVW
jgi:hypothetical protein